MARLDASNQDLEFEVCDYCNARIQDAEFLPCTHVVCVVCFEEAVTGDSRTGCLICDEANLRRNDTFVVCSLCTDEMAAVCRCTYCHVYLCEFCEQAHTRQKQTSDHIIVGLETETVAAMLAHPDEMKAPSIIEDSPLPSCEHVSESANNVNHFYCEKCQILVCLGCRQEDHTGHQVICMKDMDTLCFERLQNLLSKTQPLISTLKESMVTLEDLRAGVNQKTSLVREEVCLSIDNHIAALEDHKMYLITELERIRVNKIQQLSAQLVTLTSALENIHQMCEITSSVLSPSSHLSNSISAKLSVARQLEDLIDCRYDYKPQEDDYIRFVPNVKAGLKKGFEVQGIIDTQTPSVVNSYVYVEDASEAKQRRGVKYVLTVVDRDGTRKLNGGDRVEMRVQTSSGNLVKTRVVDREDGSYELLFTPDISGDHRVSVHLCGKHVQGSPFFINVRARKKHRGVFHCCTFCSTGGKMHVPCGCGSKIPGGYSGCGHGHEGHPGCFHWSCCGSVEENSDCTGN